VNFVFLHGFLNDSGIWKPLIETLQSRGYGVWAPDLFSHEDLGPRFSFDQWQKKFVSCVREKFVDAKTFLVGYSMGGRLGLHAMVSEPGIWSGALLLSVNPGLLSGEDGASREEWEKDWAERFRRRSWGEVVSQWNAQSVFAGSAPLNPPEFNREAVALSLTQWSLTRHRFTLNDLKELKLPLNWWFGAKDRKFLDVMDQLRGQNVPGDYAVIEGCGHRIPMDNPEQVAEFLMTKGE